MVNEDLQEPLQDLSVRPTQRTALRLCRRSAVVAWISGVYAFGLTWVQHKWQVPHPHPLPLILLLAVMNSAAAVSLATGLGRVVLGPRRLAALACAAASLPPLLAWAAVGLYAQAQWRQRRVPNDPAMNLAKVLGVTFMRLEASYAYPNRLETERMVMFYDRLDHPRRDAAAMDGHLARMEGMLGGPLRAKVFWVRGRLPRLGQGSLSVHGIALGSGESPPDWGLGGSLDRHELAHAALDMYRAHDADPAYLLHEGWAESQSGVGTEVLARRALERRAADQMLGIRDMVGPKWYHRDFGPVYPLGGAFVDFLIRRYGVARFVRPYNEGKPAAFDAACRNIFGSDLSALEAEFWEDVRRQVQGPLPRRPPRGVGPGSARSPPGSGVLDLEPRGG